MAGELVKIQVASLLIVQINCILVPFLHGTITNGDLVCSTCVSTPSGPTGCFPPALCLQCVHKPSQYCLATLYDLEITHTHTHRC